jgi:predicted MFS family arabinose efflux permease
MELTKSRGESAQRSLVAVFFLQGITNTLMIPRIPELIQNLGVQFTTWGLIIGVSGAGSLIGLFFAARMISLWGTRIVSRWGMIISGIGMVSLAFIYNPWIFFFVQLAMAIAGGALSVALNAQALALQKLLGKVIIGRFHGTWSIGAAISVAVSGAMASFVPLSIHFLVIGGTCVIGLYIATRGLLLPEEVGKADSSKAPKKVPLLKTPKQVWLLTAGLFAGMFPELCFMDWSAVFAKAEIGVNASLGALPYTMFGIAMIIGRLSITRLTKKFHISELSKWGGIFGSITLGAGVILGPLLAEVDPILGLTVLTVLWGITGLGMASMVPSFISGAGYVKGISTAQALAVMNMANTAIVIVAKIIMGALAQGVELQAAFIFPTVMMFCAGFIAHQVAKRAKRADAIANAFPMTGSIGVVSD